MKLHLDKIAFEQIISETSTKYKVRQEILEKDYYVTLLLQELSAYDKQGYAYFKGGTALYKALKSIRRFSEDVDLTVYIENCPTPSQAKKRLENATLKYKCLPKGKTLQNERGSIVCEYLYDSIFSFDSGDSLQRYEKVKVEATSFTISEPTTKIEIAPHLYELCSEEQKEILRNKYEVFPFIIETISLERIFIDKVFAAEFYFERSEYGDVAKHIYDLTVLFENNLIKRFFANKGAVMKIIQLKRQEELVRKGGVNSNLKIKDFSYFEVLHRFSEFEKAFDRMQRIYVFSNNDKLSVQDAFNALSKIHRIFDNMNL